VQGRRAATAVGQMAGGARLLDKELLAGDDGIGGGIGRAGEPGGVLHGLHYGNPSAHDCVIRTAILLAEEVVAPGLGGSEPHGVVVAGNNVHLDAKGGDGKIVNDVFTGKDKLDVAADGNVQLIDFAQAGGLLDLPHPLLSDDVDIEGVHGHTAIIHIDDRAPAKHAQSQKE